MDSSKIKAIIVAIITVFAALYLGIKAATAQFETVAWVVGVGGAAICFLLEKKIWLLIPFLGAINLTLMIPGKPTSLQVAQALVIGFSILMLLTRKLPFRLKFTELEFWILFLLMSVLQVYMRNPTGLNILASDTVGGRPYALFLLTLLTALVLAGLRVPATELRTAMNLSIFGGILNLIVGVVGMLVPSVGYWFGVGSSTDTDNNNEAIDEGRATRITTFVFIPITLASWVSSRINPVKGCLSLRWAPLILLSVAFAALSGYRNVIASVGLTYLVGIFYHGRMASVLAAGLMGGLGLLFLAIGNMVMPFPPNVQRALSVLPGTWEERHALDAKSSTDWRVEIWTEVLMTDQWIKNKVLGDGLGFTTHELAIQQKIGAMKYGGGMGMSGFDAHRETILSNGDYHSGPVSAIRTIGYVGLLIMVLAQFRLVVHAHRQIMRCKGTEWFPVALFFCIPIVWAPVFFWFIFGGFVKDAPAILMAAGMLRLLENNIPLPAYIPRRRGPYVLPSRNATAD